MMARVKRTRRSASDESPTRSSTRDSTDRATTVPHQDDMDDETFVKHWNARHRGLTGEVRHRPDLAPGLWRTLRAWHRRSHLLYDFPDHIHLDDEEDVL